MQSQYAKSSAFRMSSVRDIPPVSGSIIWAKQVCVSSWKGVIAIKGTCYQCDIYQGHMLYSHVVDHVLVVSGVMVWFMCGVLHCFRSRTS